MAPATVLLSTSGASEIGALVRLLDPVPYATSALVIVTACLLAALLPIWRAVRIDPIATLRKE
jgi:ABC-type antimicrobial peptide transport system permease subunit